MRDGWLAMKDVAPVERFVWAPVERAEGPLVEADVREIRRLLGGPCWVAPAAIAAHYGIGVSMVSMIKLRRVWKHVDPPREILVRRVDPVVARAAELRLGSFSPRRGQKARTAAARLAWEMIAS